MGVFSQYLDTNAGPVSVHLQQQQQYLTVALDCKMIHICTDRRKPGKLCLHHGSIVQLYVSCISLISSHHQFNHYLQHPEQKIIEFPNWMYDIYLTSTISTIWLLWYFTNKHRHASLPGVLFSRWARQKWIIVSKAEILPRVCAVSFYGIISWHGLRSGKQVHYLHYFVLKGHKSFICDATLETNSLKSHRMFLKKFK